MLFTLAVGYLAAAAVACRTLVLINHYTAYPSWVEIPTAAVDDRFFQHSLSALQLTSVARQTQCIVLNVRHTTVGL